MSRLSIHPFANGAFYHEMVAKHGSPLLALDCNKLKAQYQSLSAALPGVELYYAIKSLPHSDVIRTLLELGSGFDIATSGEIELLRQQKAQPRHTIHTHPIKRDQDIRDALRFGCTTFVVDNVYELEKFVAYRSRVGLLLRISFPNPDSRIDLSRKFGCSPDEAQFLLHKARGMGLHVKGLSFHAGSQCPTSDNHVFAIQACDQLIRQYYQETERLLSVLDIGGGFPVNYLQSVPDIDLFCGPIRDALSTLPDHIQVIAEPGRFLTAPAMTHVASVIGKSQRGQETWYYLDDGVYGAYSGQLFDHAIYPLEVFSDVTDTQPAVLAGPTCDSIDIIAEGIDLPTLLLGDLVIGRQMGAYTSASATDFNLFERAKIVTIGESQDSLAPLAVAELHKR